MNVCIRWVFFILASLLPIRSLAQIWVARYNGPGNGWDGGKAVAVDSSGNVYVAGASDGVGSLYDYAIIKYSPSGVEQWVARYNGPGDGSDEANAITVDHSGNIYVTGHSEGGAGTGSDYATIKYNSSGVEQWVARYNGPGNMGDGAGSIVLDNLGNVYVTGYSVGSGSVSDYATVKYDASGVEQWAARYNAPSNSYDAAIAIALDHTGAVYVTGTSEDSVTDDDYVTIKYDASGVEQWVARYDGPANGRDGARAMGIDSSGHVYVTGSSVGVGSDNDYATVKYDPSGVEQWVVRYNGPANHWDDASAIVVDHLCNICVTGRSVDADLEDDYATIKYDSSGVEQWVARYDGPDNSYDDARAMTVDNAGNVYVTGYSTGLVTGHDYATVKYNSSGVEQWVVRYNGPANGCDDALANIVDDLGYVYVTGWSRGPGTGFDYATIKYSCTGVEEKIVRLDSPSTIPGLHIYPNPFKEKTDIRYQIPEGVDSEQYAVGSIRIHDIVGRLVKIFSVPTAYSVVPSVITWDGHDDQNRKLPSGVYFLSLKAENFSATEKLLLIR